MTKQSVLIDGSQFLSKTATGIGSYGRTLTGALKTSGFDVTVLYGRHVTKTRNQTPQSLAVQVFGSERLPERRLIRAIRQAPFLIRSTFGLARSVRPDQVLT